MTCFYSPGALALDTASASQWPKHHQLQVETCDLATNQGLYAEGPGFQTRTTLWSLLPRTTVWVVLSTMMWKWRWVIEQLVQLIATDTLHPSISIINQHLQSLLSSISLLPKIWCRWSFLLPLLLLLVLPCFKYHGLAPCFSTGSASRPFQFSRGKVAFLTFSPIIPASFTDVTIPVANTFGESGPPLDATKTYRFAPGSEHKKQVPGIASRTISS